jgi:hypothetical protein
MYNRVVRVRWSFSEVLCVRPNLCRALRTVQVNSESRRKYPCIHSWFDIIKSGCSGKSSYTNIIFHLCSDILSCPVCSSRWIIQFTYFFIIFFAVLGIEPRTHMLVKHSTVWAMPQVHYYWVILKVPFCLTDFFQFLSKPERYASISHSIGVGYTP